MKMATFRLSLGKHLFCKIQRRMERTLLVLAVLDVLGWGCVLISAYSSPGLGFGHGEGAELCVFPSNLFLAGTSHPTGVHRWSSLLPPDVSVISKWVLLGSKCCASHQSHVCRQQAESLGSSFALFLGMTGLTRVSRALLLSYWII